MDNDSGLPSSVIVKQVTATEFTDSENGGASQRLLNEWAALQFLGALSKEAPWPQLLAASSEASLVVLEDLGARPSVEDMLFSNDRASAKQGLKQLGSSLGQMHGLGYEHTDEFSEIQSKLGTQSPRSDSNFDVRDSEDAFRECFDFLDINQPSTFWSEIDSLEDAIHNPGGFHTVIHADAGPQNFIWTGNTTRIIDFEFVTLGHGILDLVSARLGFPHSAEGHTVPLAVVESIEDSYRFAVAATIPQIEDEVAFNKALVDTCAHWALVRWAFRWQRLLGTSEGEDEDSQAQLRRSQVFTVLKRFVATAETTRHAGAIASAITAFTEALENRHPDLVEMPVFPALANNTRTDMR